MQSFVFRREYWTRLAVCSCLAVAAAMLLAGWLGLEQTLVEAGPLEGGQELLLLATAIVYACAAFYQHKADRLASVGAALLAGVFFFRELELPVSGPLTAYLNSDAFRWHEALVVLAIAVPYIASRWRLFPEFIRFLRTRNVWPFGLVAVLLLAGGVFEEVDLSEPFVAMFLEETAETLAYLAFAATGLHVFTQTRAQAVAAPQR